METATATLPVSILLPTRNSAQLLPSHLQSLQALLPLAAEVVVVDSESTDGTLDLLRQKLSHPSLRIFPHPPGLYESWNHGVAQCRSNYVYLSTVGDSLTRRGLEHLVATAEAFSCDVVVSPPALVDERGKGVRKRWPVHDFVAQLGLTRPTVLQGTTALILALVYLRKAILGSSASNLYRAETLRRFPFPTDFGHAGDVGWGLRHAGNVRFGIVPEVHSTFLFHRRSSPKKRVAGLAQKRLATAETSVAQTEAAPEVKVLMRELCSAWREANARAETVEARRRNPLWIAAPAAWRERAQRTEALARLASAQQRALQWIRDSLPQNARTPSA